MDRRTFLKSGAGALLAAAASGCASAPAGACARASRGVRTQFHIAMAGYTYNKFSLDETLAALVKYDVHYLCVKNFHLPYTATPAEMAAFRRRLADCGVTPYGAGPITMTTPDEAKRYFDYTAALGAGILVGVPGEKDAKGRLRSSRKMCETCAALCPQYGIKFAIHNHGANPKTGNPLLYPTAPATWEYIKDLGPSMGFCLDIAYTFADGFDPAEIVRRYAGRIFDGHLRNISDPGNGSSGIVAHQGVIDYLSVFRAFAETGYDGCLGLELANSFPAHPEWIPESLGYFRGLLAAV